MQTPQEQNTRMAQCIIALYTHLSEDGNNAETASAALREKGFTGAEIAIAAQLMLQGAQMAQQQKQEEQPDT